MEDSTMDTYSLLHATFFLRITKNQNPPKKLLPCNFKTQSSHNAIDCIFLTFQPNNSGNLLLICFKIAK